MPSGILARRSRAHIHCGPSRQNRTSKLFLHRPILTFTGANRRMVYAGSRPRSRSTMQRTRVTRLLRIATSAVFLIACVLMIALWVRSYHTKDDFRGTTKNHVLNIQSIRGDLGIGLWAWRFKPIPWHLSSWQVDESFEQLWPPVKNKPPLSLIGIRWQRFPNDMAMVVFQFWALALVFAALAAAPWIKWRFSLRTLLIVTTLIAVALWLMAAITK